jgi:hypothetical protein
VNPTRATRGILWQATTSAGSRASWRNVNRVAILCYEAAAFSIDGETAAHEWTAFARLRAVTGSVFVRLMRPAFGGHTSRPPHATRQIPGLRVRMCPRGLHTCAPYRRARVPAHALPGSLQFAPRLPLPHTYASRTRRQAREGRSALAQAPVAPSRERPAQGCVRGGGYTHTTCGATS